MPDVFWRAIGAAKGSTASTFEHVPVGAPGGVDYRAASRGPRRGRRKGARKGFANINPALLKSPHAIALYEEGVATADIARDSGYSTTSVRDQLRGVNPMSDLVRDALVNRIGEDGLVRVAARMKELNDA